MAMDIDNFVLSIQEEEAEGRVGSVIGRRTRRRDRWAGDARLFDDYFAVNPVYDDVIFRRRFRMRRSLFLRIVEDVKNYDDYFMQKRDAANVLGLSSLQKVTAALRQLAYGCPADSLDEYLRLGESTAIKCLAHFCRAIVGVYKQEYIRIPNQQDNDHLLRVGESRGFPGMIASLDCMHWEWKNCPKALAGQYTGRGGKPTVVLEAAASYDLWIWHTNFGYPGSLNDINILDRSDVFSCITNANAPDSSFSVNNNQYGFGYFLADGIYPNWATLVKTYSAPSTIKEKVRN
jgi:hypothetical protein